MARRFVIGIAAIALTEAASAQVVLPEGFQIDDVATGFAAPVDIAFADDGRIFVAEQEGRVRVVQDGVVLPEPFIDLTEEVQGEWDRGMLGIALHPEFLVNHQVYLLYMVDPVYGRPDESPWGVGFGRLTCYTGTAESNGNVADLDSRCVLIGQTLPEGIITCEPSHSIGTVRFAHDGTLFCGAGDGASFLVADAGGADPECFGEGLFDSDQDIGAFRSQYLGSYAGKILRVDPETGLGLPSNPYWTGDATDIRSKVWVSGLRNPYRFTTRPGTPGPGTVFIGDVGWNTYEEIDVATGGENFGWPCREGLFEAPEYPGMHPAHSGCDTIETPENPGPLTDPIVSLHHSNGESSLPPGVVARCTVGGTFYTGTCYPEMYRGTLFTAGHIHGWIRSVVVNESNELVAMHDFATGLDRPVDIERHPITGDLHVLTVFEGRLQRIVYTACDPCPADLDDDGSVGVSDLLAVLAAWGSAGGAEDIDGSGIVGVGGLLIVLGTWGPCD